MRRSDHKRTRTEMPMKRKNASIFRHELLDPFVTFNVSRRKERTILTGGNVQREWTTDRHCKTSGEISDTNGKSIFQLRATLMVTYRRNIPRRIPGRKSAKQIRFSLVDRLSIGLEIYAFISRSFPNCQPQVRKFISALGNPNKSLVGCKQVLWEFNEIHHSTARSHAT